MPAPAAAVRLGAVVEPQRADVRAAFANEAAVALGEQTGDGFGQGRKDRRGRVETSGWGQDDPPGRRSHGDGRRAGGEQAVEVAQQRCRRRRDFCRPRGDGGSQPLAQCPGIGRRVIELRARQALTDLPLLCTRQEAGSGQPGNQGIAVGYALFRIGVEARAGVEKIEGNAYDEGLSDAWAPIKDYWRDPTPANRDKMRGFLTLDGMRQRYTAGLSAAQAELVSPDTWMLDWSRLSRPGNIDLQLDLFGDYRTNVALIRSSRPSSASTFRRR
jgi:hypothetical protein